MRDCLVRPGQREQRGTARRAGSELKVTAGDGGKFGVSEEKRGLEKRRQKKSIKSVLMKQDSL